MAVLGGRQCARAWRRLQVDLLADSALTCGGEHQRGGGRITSPGHRQIPLLAARYPRLLPLARRHPRPAPSSCLLPASGLDSAGAARPSRSSGGHLRYSRRKLVLAGRIRELSGQGHSLASVLRILSLGDKLALPAS